MVANRGQGNWVGNAFCWGSLAIFLWLIHSNLQGRDFALICGLFGSAGSAGCEWGRMEMMQLLLRPNCWRKERPWFEHVRTMCVMKEKESVFRFFSKGKHFPLLKLCFLCWPELSFRWLVFHVVAKHEKTRKVNSRNSLSCNQTRH